MLVCALQGWNTQQTRLLPALSVGTRLRGAGAPTIPRSAAAAAVTQEALCRMRSEEFFSDSNEAWIEKDR